MRQISQLWHRILWPTKLAGLLALLALAAALAVTLVESRDVSAAKTWNYYIAADEVEWDYAPGGDLVGSSMQHGSPETKTNTPPPPRIMPRDF